MRGYCPRCKETRSDSGENSWGIKQTKYGPACGRCGAVLDIDE